MIRAFSFAACLFFGVQSGASVEPPKSSHLTIVGPCDSKPVLKTEISPAETTLGDVTIATLNKNNLEFVGDRSGIKSIQNSPVGDEALEVLSDTEMRAYGWCVTVDGKQPDKMPDEVILKSGPHQIVWFFAFARYDRGEWKDFCTPSHAVKSLPVCKGGSNF